MYVGWGEDTTDIDFGFDLASKMAAVTTMLHGFDGGYICGHDRPSILDLCTYIMIKCSMFSLLGQDAVRWKQTVLG